MKKFGLALAALGAITFAVPSIASAETVVIKHRGGGYHGHHDVYRGARAEYRHDRGWHRGWHNGHRDKVVIVKKHRY